jgi:ribonuclease HII
VTKEFIAGVDEAGRGPLAGPVVAAAVILDDNHGITGLRDSKKLSQKKREFLYDVIFDKSASIGIGKVDVKTIDRINIREATFKAMQIALGRLSIKPSKALIDGYALNNQMIPNEGVIGGDDMVDSIKAASIIAKVTRDRLMMEYAVIFPEYGFERHKGYGTKAHFQALIEYRSTPIHRRSYKPVKNHMPTLTWISELNRVGWLGEKLAALYLKQKGISIIEMNRNCPPYGEIDILGKTEDEWIFTEVKTAYKTSIQQIEKKIDHKKLIKMGNAIYQIRKDMEQDLDFRIDCVIVNLKKTGPEIKHYEGIHLE